ncbi:cupin domain-containing protein [Fimbriiglobus ruber]|uniref:Oxalate decarboxylase n=1 Tax=Fimbriiglobus ruber TaxID=1908690 RepID=A0A225E1M1_9BACT|nr:cupin domain-containing protein [Fimbriiglobus ruber]OWK43379.1 Oxalate decarboxylase [Fimbriiglobus ruber]
MISRRAALGALAAATGSTLTAKGDTKEKAADKPAEAKGGTKEKAAETAPSFKFRLQRAKPRVYEGGSIREHRAADFPASHNISAGVVRIEAGAFREPHWHPNSDEWAYMVEGRVRLTVVGPHGQTTVEDFEVGDAWFVPIGFGHSVLNIGEGEAEVLLVHNHGDFTTIELSEWAAGGPKDVFASTLAVPEKALDNVPKKKLFVGRKRKS